MTAVALAGGAGLRERLAPRQETEKRPFESGAEGC